LEAIERIESVKVLLADDNPIFATGCALMLAGYGIELIGEGTTPKDIMVRYGELHPDVLVIDAAFGGANCGLTVARQLRDAYPDAKIVILSESNHRLLYKESYRLGAHAFVTKNRAAADLAEAVTKALAGSLYFLPHVAEQLAHDKVRGDGSPQDILIGREMEVFKLMALGHTNVEIAEELRLSAKSISNYSQAIKEKLGTQRAAELTRLAVRHGLIEP
jgi:two-component system invasion response regulator UvrY